MKFSDHICPSDIDKIRSLLESTHVFEDVEIDIALELVVDKLSNSDSTYQFLLAHEGEQLLGYTCYGEIPLTKKRYDLYWIAVNKHCQNKGIGAILLNETEKAIQAQDGEIIYIETAGLNDYAQTRHFYLKNGYQVAAQLSDFYWRENDKIIYKKCIASQ